MTKFTALLGILAFTSLTHAGPAKNLTRSVAQATANACTVVSGGANVAFKKTSSGPNDREYGTFESGTDGSITYYLRGGHGVVRLEAWEKGKLLAASWLQLTASAPGDALNLDVRTGTGGSTEAQCLNVTSATSN